MSDDKPKLHVQAESLYSRFEAEASKQTLSDGRKVSLWTGKLVETCDTVGIPYGSYRKVVSALEIMGCIQIIAKGVRGSPTFVVLLAQPTEELWSTYDASSPRPALTRGIEAARMAAEVRAFLDSVGGINIADALQNHEQRITALEGKSKSTKRSTTNKER